ncbi:hypothetical protein [Streptomyces sp. NPDC057877]|uniref:WXG100 family type VII secretion target n=1 Tax=Streptomyces sp. NPDC057877 TaxID=3346269 RepID=UPI00367A7070
MSGDGDKHNGERHQQEYQEALNQNGTLDAVMTMTRLISPFGSSRGIHFGSTNFEGYDLNDMIDIVESANPELLESAGTALVDARDAITDAAEELSKNLGKIDWQGEAHKAFSDWGDSLIKTAQGIATYADTIGTQVMAAGSGLASVRKSMPPRDNRTDRKSVDDIPEAKRDDSNEEYTAAVKAEAHRQEAINQMYRLASFYTVSAGAMGAAEEPVFPKMPDVGVPEPPPGFGPVEPSRPTAPLSPASEPTTAQQVSAAAGAERQSPAEVLSPRTGVDGVVATPRQSVGTEIDSVGTLPPQEVVKPTPGVPPSPTGTTPSTGPVPPMAPTAIPPTARGPVGRATKTGGVPPTRIPPAAQGRVNTSPPPRGPVPPGPMGRTGTGPVPGGPTGRTPTAGPVVGRGVGPTGPMGPTGRGTTPAPAGTRGAAPVQRGIVGGKPQAMGPGIGHVGAARGPVGPMGPTGAPPSGRSSAGRPRDGVVGGRPVTSGTSGGGSKLPRGTVIGGERTQGSASTTQKPGQRGVIGAPPAPANSGQTSRRTTGRQDGVIGTPNGRTPGTRNSGRAPDRDERRGDAPRTD